MSCVHSVAYKGCKFKLEVTVTCSGSCEILQISNFRVLKGREESLDYFEVCGRFMVLSAV